MIDSGALFFKNPLLPETAMEAARRTAQGIARAEGVMNPRAIGIAPHDLAAGPDFLKQLAVANNLTLLSMNLYSDKGRTPLFTPYLLTRAGDVKIALLGLTGDLPGTQKNKGLRTLPWQQSLPATLDEIENKADLVILLSSASRKVNEEIARKFNNIHIIFQSGQGGNNQPPVNINNTLLCQTAPRGKFLGLLEIKWNNTKTWGKSVPDQLKKEQNRLDRINWQIGRLQRRNTTQALAGNAKFQRLLQDKAQSEQTIRLLKKQKESNLQAQPCSYKNTFIALKESLPEDMTIKAIVDRTRGEVNEINRKTQQKHKKKHRPEGQAAAKSIFPGVLQGMAGSQACTTCHPLQSAFYLTTDHAKAWQTLAAREQQYNPDCLLCHVTLPTYNSLLVQENNLLHRLPPELRGVGCETCHGPARKHSLAPDDIRPGKPDQTICLQCHTKERDNNFIYTEKIKKVRCPVG